MGNWIKIIAIICAIAIPAFVSLRAKDQPPTPVACAADQECELRGRDEWERCHHVKDPLTPEQKAPLSRDATSKTHDGYACLCVAKACEWAGKDYQSCLKTGGTFKTLKECPPCPDGMMCKPCDTGCKCPEGKSFDLSNGCQ